MTQLESTVLLLQNGNCGKIHCDNDNCIFRDIKSKGDELGMGCNTSQEEGSRGDFVKVIVKQYIKINGIEKTKFDLFEYLV